MKKKFTLTLGLLAFFLIGSTQTASLNLAKSFNLDGNARILLNLPSDAKVVTWDKPHVNVSIQVEVTNLAQQTADNLARAGRYDLVADSANGALNIASPNTHKTVRIGGKELQEKMTYTVYVPKDIKIEVFGSTSDIAVNR